MISASRRDSEKVRLYLENYKVLPVAGMNWHFWIKLISD